MNLDKYIKGGNRFFQKKLCNYRKFGISYEDFWQKAFDDFIRFQVGSTDQGIQHCLDVENNIWKLLGCYETYLPLDILYLLSIASALHDCAKTDDKTDHAVEGAKIIKQNIVKMGYVQSQAVADAISYVVLGHSSGDFSSLPEIIDIKADVEIRIKDIAAVFRLADMMSTSEDRAARVHRMLDLNHIHIKEFLNNVRLRIRSCIPSESDRSCIEIRVDADDIDSRRNIEKYIEGLNRDMTQEHQKILQNIKTIYLTKKFMRKTKNLTLPYKFIAIWAPPLNFNILENDKPQTISSRKASKTKKGFSRLVPCYFVSTETNIGYYRNLLDSIDKGIVDSKYLYWSLRGTKEYLNLCNNPNYDLPNVAHGLLTKSFVTDIYPLIGNSNIVIDHIINNPG